MYDVRKRSGRDVQKGDQVLQRRMGLIEPWAMLCTTDTRSHPGEFRLRPKMCVSKFKQVRTEGFTAGLGDRAEQS